jgi:multidrug/hemolysin transport system permease protein
MKSKALIIRNIKMFFSDKGMVFSSMITPLILLVLYSTFLSKVFRDSFISSMPQGFTLPEGVIDATVAGQLLSSLIAVSCITVAFCSNMLSVQDKVTGARSDFGCAPVKSSTLSISYYAATAVSTIMVLLIALAACLVYVRSVGWYMSVADILYLLLDILLLVLFGTALSSIANIFIKTEGQMSAVGTIVSAGYGFICGAYMPISNFGEGLQKVLSFLPGTYGTSLVRNHAMRGVLDEMSALGVPEDVIGGIMEAMDCKLYFFGTEVTQKAMYIWLAAAVAVLIGIYVIINIIKTRKSV